MASAKDHFALDWIKTDLLETLSEARVALDTYAEQEDETRLRACLTGLHQVHGTLVMLELKGVTLLADHMEQLSQSLLAGDVADPAAASQALMQGILELPGHLEELQRGAEDGIGAFVPLVNEMRGNLGMEPLEDRAGSSLVDVPDEKAIARFEQIDGPGKVAKIRSAYQNVLLSILKGEDRRQAVQVLQKIAASLERISAGTALAREWQAFGQFVVSLTYQEGALEAEAVKLLRRVDLEIKSLAKEGAGALRRPVNVELIQQLLDAATARDHQSEELEGLKQAVTRDVKNNAMAISGRQAMSAAAGALKEDLAVIKDKLDLIVRAGSVDLDELRQLIAPLKKVGSTLSVLGFESSKAIVSDQVEAIESLVVLGDTDPQAVQSIAGALVQIDENLSSVAQGSEQTEVEQITSEAQLQLLREARKGLELIKQNVVDFVTTHWDIRHLSETPATIAEICGALEIVPLKRPVAMLGPVSAYITDRLIQGHRPEWQELDLFADVVSAIDYYLERMSEDNPAGADDILSVAERSLSMLERENAGAAEAAPVEDAATETELAALDVPSFVGHEEDKPTERVDDFVAELEPIADTTSAEAGAEAPESAGPQEAVLSVDAAARAGAGTHAVQSGLGDESEDEKLDAATIVEQVDPQLELESEAAFDLSSDEFAELEGTIEDGFETELPQEADALHEAETELSLETELPEEAEQETGSLEDAATLFDTALESVDHSAREADSVAHIDEPTSEAISADATADAMADVASSPEPAVEPPDPEIVEIFVEEVGEVLETIDEFLPLWAATLEEGEALTEVRRAFHTLKGSGRIVQANAIGELAWGVENMLNRVIDGTVTPTEQFAQMARAARDKVPELSVAFAAGNELGVTSVASLIEQADLLASGGKLELAPDVPATAPEEAVAVPETGPETTEVEAAEQAVESVAVEPVAAQTAEATTEAAEVEALEPETSEADEEDLAGEDANAAQELLAQAPDEAETLDTASLETGEMRAVEETLDDVGTLDEEANADLPEFSVDAMELDNELSTTDLFLEEASLHLETIDRENAAVPWKISQDLARAFHTLAGTAAIADVEQVKLIVESAYQVVEAYRDDEPSDRLQEFFVQAAIHLHGCLLALGADSDWDEPIDFVAAADDLLAMRTTAKRPVEELLDSAAVTALFSAEDVVASLLEGDTSQQADFVDALSEIVALARAADIEPIADLATAYSASLSRIEEGNRAPDSAKELLAGGHEALVDQFNAVAAGGRPQARDELIAGLSSLQLTKVAQAEVVEPQPVEQAQAPAPAAVAEPLDIDTADIDPDLVDVFFEEAEELAEEIEGDIVRWSGENENRLYMENLLRELHTLKGGARLCGLSVLGDMAHDFESLVIEVQDGARGVDANLFAELNNRYDQLIGYLARVKAQIEGQEAPAEPGINLGEPAPTRASTTAQAQAPDEFPAAAESSTPEPADSLQGADIVDLRKDTEHVSGVNAVLEEFVGQQHANEPREVSEIAPEKDKEAAEEPKRSQQEMVRVGSALLEELVNLAGENSILRARIEQGMSDFTSSLDEMEITIERLREQLRRLEIETETQILFRHDRTAGPSYENFDPLEMDRYSQLQQLSRGLSESASDMLDLKDTLLFKARESETLLLQQARINTELQEGLMRTRMVPFSRLLPRLRRIVRQVAGELDKDVEFHVQNGEGELDRNLLERMVPPLEHMLRNAVDHGIESAEMRRNFGKSPTGRIDLRLTREGGDVVLEISDDGAGVDVESVREKAIERGLMAPEANLSDEEVTQFVLAPGFSTAKSVTQISGRGVGMDVVHSEVKQLGGSINIVSRAGYGSRFIVRVPFTVSVNRALMVSVAEDLYALPLNTIEGIVLLGPEQLQQLYTSESKTFEYAGIPYRVRYLGQYIGREFHGPAAGQGSVPVVLVRSGDHAVAIHVDAVQGSREIVVKSLGPQFAGVGGISGATILGDGSVVVILDLLALIRAQQHKGTQHKQPSLAQPGRPRCVMVVDDSVTVRKVTSRLLERQGMDVLVAKDGIEAVALLQERRPDIMLLDIEMPRMDGFEVARQVRHDDRLGSLPIVMISSRTGDKHKEHASELGVNKFLGKPFQENELLATIDELVTR